MEKQKDKAELKHGWYKQHAAAVALHSLPEVEYSGVRVREALILGHHASQQLRVESDCCEGWHEPAVAWRRDERQGRVDQLRARKKEGWSARHAGER